VIRIAIVEDEPEQIDRICSYTCDFMQKTGDELEIHTFSDGDEILEAYQPGCFDILLLDIQMKRMDGVTAARRIRALDEHVVIIFITNIAQYAVQGYSVQALDFIVKPIEYDSFEKKLSTALQHVYRQSESTICIKSIDGILLLKLEDIVCVEIISRKLFIHTKQKAYQCNETLQGIEDKLNDGRFYRCHAAYLVNLQHIHQITRLVAVTTHIDIPISRHRYKGLMDALTSYLGRQMKNNHGLEPTDSAF